MTRIYELKNGPELKFLIRVIRVISVIRGKVWVLKAQAIATRASRLS